jgi:hypothetical protein
VATPVKFGTLTVISNELAMDSSPDITNLLEMQMLRSLALRYDWRPSRRTPRTSKA